jgi:hypothetical protein
MQDQIPFTLSKEYVDKIEQRELRKISSAKMRRSVQEQEVYNKEQLNNAVRKQSGLIAVDILQAKTYAPFLPLLCRAMLNLFTITY